MTKTQKLQTQAERMQQLTKELLRRYQMRDRNEITCCGITVSQCYALDALGEHGEMAMIELAGKLYLDKSTATRAIDPLVERGLVQRRFSEQDRREILVSLTPAGAKLHNEIIAHLQASQRQILERIPLQRREDILAALEILSSAMQEWLVTCCLPRKVQLQTKTKKGASHE
jgi:DNA-binding MarR family transcriptional regulator